MNEDVNEDEDENEEEEKEEKEEKEKTKKKDYMIQGKRPSAHFSLFLRIFTSQPDFNLIKFPCKFQPQPFVAFLGNRNLERALKYTKGR